MGNRESVERYLFGLQLDCASRTHRQAFAQRLLRSVRSHRDDDNFATLLFHQLEPHLERFKAENDDYSDILLKALSDRLAESFAEVLHAEVRQRLWGYADEHLSNEQLIREKYHGIRPAPGYPACPDHSLKPILFEMLGGNPGEVTLTENFAMLPTSAVSGFYFAHRDSQYFGVARIGEDQLTEYAGRRGVDLDCARRWLRPNLD